MDHATTPEPTGDQESKQDFIANIQRADARRARELFDSGEPPGPDELPRVVKEYNKLRYPKVTPIRKPADEYHRMRALGLLRDQFDKVGRGDTSGYRGRDDMIKDKLRYLAPLVYDSNLTRDELLTATIEASQRCGHIPDNKSYEAIERDVDRAIEKFAEPFDWSALDTDRTSIATTILAPIASTVSDRNKQPGQISMAAAEPDATADLLAGMRSAAALDDMVLAPLVEHVPWLITEGFGILAGAPKVGKSWLALALALAVAQGGKVLNSIEVKPRAVLLLALEDGDRRLQTRMRKVNGDDPLPENLDYLTDVQPQVLIPTITAWLAQHAADERPPLVILDTFGKARGQRKPGDDPYIADYQLGTQFKRAADTVPGAAILAIHHTRKMAADDWVASVTGSQGITGSADYVLVLTRKRKSDEGLLAVTGRDIREEEYALLVTDGIWQLDGHNLIMAAEQADERRDKGNLNERSQAVLEFVNSRAQTGPGDLVTELDIDRRQASVYLARLADAGRIRKTGRGTYAPLENSVVSVVSVVTPAEPGPTGSPSRV